MKVLELNRIVGTLFLLALIWDMGGRADQAKSLDAQTLWDMAIKAKGGREKLHEINNILISAGDNSFTFIAFPGKYFSWFDARPTEFGLTVDVHNFETGFGYAARVSKSVKEQTFQDIRTMAFSNMEIINLQLIYLLETKWIKPEVLSAEKSKVNGKNVDLIKVLVKSDKGENRIGVFLDEQTHLPIRIGYIHPNGGHFFRIMNMRGYRDFDGLMLPTETSVENIMSWNKVNVDYNVSYDSKLFDQVPDLETIPFKLKKFDSPELQPLLNSKHKSEAMVSSQIAKYVQDLTSSDNEIIVQAQHELLAIGHQALPALTNMLRSSVRPFGYRAAVVILEIDKENKAAMAALPGFVIDPHLSTKERQDAAFGLLRNDEGITILTEMLVNSDPIVRRFAVFAFDELTERPQFPKIVEKAVPSLRQLTQEKDEVIRKMAVEVLEQIANRFKPQR